MPQTQQTTSFEAARKVAPIVWIAMILPVLFYGGLLYFMAANSWEPGGREAAPAIQWVLAAMALVSAGVSTYFHRSRAAPETVLPQAEDEAAAVGRFMANYITAWAMAESVAIFGLVLSFLSQQASFYFPFGVAALVLLAFQRPQVDQWQRAFEERKGNG